MGPEEPSPSRPGEARGRRRRDPPGAVRAHGGRRGDRTDKYDCGQVKKKCANKNTSGGWTILCVATLDFDSTGGDSGAPVIRTDSANRWPAFEEVAPSTRRVIVGTVVGSARVDQTEFSPVFTVEVDDVLTGEAPAMIEVNALKSGRPLRGEKTCRRSSNLYATLGDRVAIAFGGKVPGVKGRVNSAAWIEGEPHPVANPGLGSATLDDVRQVMGLEPVPSFRAVLSGQDATIEGDVVVLDRVAIAPWLSDTPSPSVGQWDVTTFLAGWSDRRADLDSPRAQLRVADGDGAWDRPVDVRDIAVDGLEMRLELAVEPGQAVVAQGGPTTLFLEIEDDPEVW